MRGELVAIDLETTGFDPATDAIIEVGAVRLLDGRILEEYSSLVNPGISIPANITQLTGIRTEDVLSAPTIAQILPAIRTFAGNVPIVGHNVGFDLNFLQRHNILQNNLRVDTYDLASILMPRAPRYTLSSLTNDINIDLENAHRALDDARASALLYWMLWQKMLTLPYATLYEINAAAQNLDWDARPVLEAALREHPNATQPKTPSETDLIKLFSTADGDSSPLRPTEINTQLETEHVIHLIESGGLLAQHISGYEERPQQIEMARAVTNAFNQSQHTMIEAGTGTGKSIAYLVPAIVWATNNHERVVISTNTINLQEQLILNDIPTLQKALNIPFKAAIMKGRSNYLCPRRLMAVRRRRPTSIDELRTLAKILVWLLESPSGDKGEISLRGPAEHETWQRLSAEDEGCTMDRCSTAMAGACPFYKARKAAESAHILIVNHALLLSDAAADNRILPDYRYLVIDEAHHLEEAITSSLGFRLDEAALHRRLADLGSPHKGLLGSLLNSTGHHIPDKDLKRLETIVKHISAATNAMEVHVQSLFKGLREFYSDVTSRSRTSDYNTPLRITDQERSKNSFIEAAATWSTLKEFFEAISEAMRRLTEFLSRLEQYNIPDYNDLVNSAGAAARYLEEVRTELNAFITEPSSNTIYWLNAGQNIAYMSIHSAPLHVGSLMDQYIWNAKESVIVTSATLQTNHSFDYVRERLHAEHVSTMNVGSPFDYKESTLIFIPNDMPEPNDKHHYQQAVERGFIELAAALNGRVLGLFTSYTHLRQTAQAITPRLALGNIAVYDQSDGSSRQALLDGFKSAEKAVLLGTKSFWEGIDIPGESLSALVITRLPFAVPTDPIFAARSETYNDSFNEYAVQDAILRFRQGFGRLIRTRADRGIVAIFDRRIISKAYGVNFLEALPECTVQSGSLRILPDVAKDWLNRSKM